MLHQPADHIRPSDAPTVFDAKAYVADMRAGGVELVEINGGFALRPVGKGFGAGYSAAQARWQGLVDELAQQQVTNLLADERGRTEAAALIGDDLATGLAETRRLKAEALAAYDGERTAPECRLAGAKADRAGHHHHYEVMHTAALPARTLTEIAAKAQFALEQRDYSTDDDFAGDVLKELIQFAAPDFALPVEHALAA